MGFAAKAELFDERSEVADIVRHNDAALGRGCTKDHVIVLPLEVRTIALYGDGIDAVSPELLSDRAGVVLVEQQPQALATRRRVRASRCSRTRL